MAGVFKIIPIATPNPYGSVLSDTLQRPLRDLRISVTDRCNLRCTYCMPRAYFDEHHQFLARSELLSFEEIERVAKLFLQLGVQKIRLTGGEPLMRKGLEKLIAKLAALTTSEGKTPEIALTTNGVLLAKQAQALKEAGLQRITISLDGLSNDVFQRMSDSNVNVAHVLDAIAVAQQVGFAPVKVNMVVQRGVNEHELIPMAEHFRHSGVVLRFIEYMDVGCTNGWRMDEVMSAREMLDVLGTHYPLQAVDANYTGEVAERWQYQDGAGEIGVIASVTQAFCQDCTRMRLSTDGRLFNCLFSNQGADLRGALRAGADDAMLRDIIAAHWQQRNDRYSQLRHAANQRDKIEMSYIGG